jgi:hypothetical protein
MNDWLNGYTTAGDEEEEEIEEEKELEDSEWAKAVQSGRISKGEKLVPVDHSKVSYPPFRKVTLLA